MSLSRNLAGILAPVGRVRQADLDAFAKARLRLIRLRARVNAPDDILQWRDAGAIDFIVQLLSPLPAQTPLTPHMFVDHFSADISAFLERGVRYIEVHDEPNRPDRGVGVSWFDGDGFSSWFFETHRLLRTRFGDALSVGFPALSPTDLPRPEYVPHMDEVSFLEGCTDAMAAADWVAIHSYWRTLEEMRGYNGALRFLRFYMEQLPKQMFIITEFANIIPNLPSETRGAQYVEFYTTLAQYDHLAGACSLLLRSSDPLYEPLAWLNPDGQPRPMLSWIAERPALPDPQRMWMIWPTEYRQYNQYFGANQQTYFDCCGMAGGHNGVDLRVDRTSPDTSPIYAALVGTVSQVALDETGYEHHVRVRGYGPDGEEITLIYAHLSTIDVAVGMLIKKGDVLGWAGSTGQGKGSHLHLGMRVKGVHNGSVSDWLNPRPYLEAKPRGLPREPYTRTYVLLPPNADSAWASAVVRETWDKHRYTMGGSADDAGIGTLGVRRIIAVNPGHWTDGDLEAFFLAFYQGVTYIPVTAVSPDALPAEISTLKAVPDQHPAGLPWPYGLPRVPYSRTYLLLAPHADKTWALAAVAATWDRYRFTIGRSADDAGLGDLDNRRVISINPEAWGGDLAAFFADYYPGVTFVPIQVDSPTSLAAAIDACAL